MRSPAAEAVFTGCPNVETDPAGLASDADTRLSAEQRHWADLIIAMEPLHRRQLMQGYRSHRKDKRVMVLDMHDDYALMQPEPINRLLRKVAPLLRRYLVGDVRKLPPA